MPANSRRVRWLSASSNLSPINYERSHRAEPRLPRFPHSTHSSRLCAGFRHRSPPPATPQRRPLTPRAVREVARAGFSGTSSELLLLLSKLASDSTRRSRRWPKAPNALSSALRRMAGSLRSTGIEIDFNRADHQGRRVISVKSASLVPQRSSASSAPSAP